MAYIRNLISVYISNFDWVERQTWKNSLALRTSVFVSMCASVCVRKERTYKVILASVRCCLTLFMRCVVWNTTVHAAGKTYHLFWRNIIALLVLSFLVSCNTSCNHFTSRRHADKRQIDTRKMMQWKTLENRREYSSTIDSDLQKSRMFYLWWNVNWDWRRWRVRQRKSEILVRMLVYDAGRALNSDAEKSIFPSCCSCYGRDSEI